MVPIPLRLRKVLISAVHEVPPDLEMPKGGRHKQTTILGQRLRGAGLDPSLDHYVSTKGKTASIALPPL
jgi:hypothetical protein